MGFRECRGGSWRVGVRHGGKVRRLTLGAVSEAEAIEALVVIERGLRLVAQGALDPPPGCDLPLWLLSQGKRGQARPAVAPLKGCFDAYIKTNQGVLEPNTLGTVAIHATHWRATLGDNFDLTTLTRDDIQRHLDRRKVMPGRRGRSLSPETCRKEVQALSAVWAWAKRRGLVVGPYPGADGLLYPKGVDLPPFRTRAEIEARLNQGEWSAGDRRELWACLYLTPPELADVLGWIKGHARAPWVYPALVFAAHTGARRSEVLRARPEDLDLVAGLASIREKKRVKGRDSTRRVPLSAALAGVLGEWTAIRPAGETLFCWPDGRKVGIYEARYHLKASIKGGPWEVVPGWHCLRHSFASNCVAAGIDSRLLSAWLGHQTAEMTARYAHLAPDLSRRAIDSVFGA